MTFLHIFELLNHNVFDSFVYKYNLTKVTKISSILTYNIKKFDISKVLI